MHTSWPLPRLPAAGLGALLLLLAGCAAPAPQPPASLPASPLAAPQLPLSDGSPGLPRAGVAEQLPALRAKVLANPQDAEALTELALAAEAAGEVDEASAAIGQALTVAPSTEARLLLRGRLDIRRNSAASAAEVYRLLLAANPQRVEALNGLGVALDMLGRHPEAQEQYRAGLAARPGDWNLRGNLALSLVSANRAREAVAVLAEAETDPNAPRRARHNLALALVAAGQQDRAAQLLRADQGPAETAQLIATFERYAAWARQYREARSAMAPR